MMDRKEYLKALAARLTDEIVVATYSSASDWLDIADRPLNYFSVGAMGLASSHGLGLALARPERRVIIIDGDGSLLMNLGTLVTIGAVAPVNFTHLVSHNGSYEANGGQPIPNKSVDFAAIARGAGYKACHTISEIADFESKLDDLLHADGPLFADLMIEQGAIKSHDYPGMYSADRRALLRKTLDADN